MNRRRRASLRAVIKELERLKDTTDKEEAIGILQKSCTDVETCMDEEQDALDARPESMQWSSINDDMNDNISDLTDALCDLESLAEECGKSKDYSYGPIEESAITIANIIKQVIYR